RDLAGHLLGSLDVNSGPVRSARAWRRAGKLARRNATRQLDEATAAEVAAYAAVPDTEVAAAFDRLAARNIRRRHRIPAPIRRTALDLEGARLTVGEFAGMTLLRDSWMHRLDLCRATGQDPSSPPAMIAGSSPTWSATGPAGTAGPSRSRSSGQPAEPTSP